MAEQQPPSDQGAGSERDVAVHREPALGGDIPPLVADAGDEGRDRGRLGRVLPSCASAHEDASGWGVGGRLDADIVRDPDGVDGDGGGAYVQAVADQAGREGSIVELSTMELCSTHLAFHENKWASGWGHGNALPMFISSSKATSLLLAAPPFTVRLRKTTENLNILQVNFVMVLYTESDTVVLPPDVEDSEGRSIPFYLDPPNQPGWHRDAFRAHAKTMLGPLLEKNFPLSGGLSQQAPALYHQQRAAAEAAAEAASEAAAADALGLEIVDAILDVRKGKRKRNEYLVQWAGYQAEWEEQYRQGLGEVGGPFMSWEPESKLKHLTQLADWKAAHPEAEAAQAEAAQTEAAQAQA